MKKVDSYARRGTMRNPFVVGEKVRDIASNRDGVITKAWSDPRNMWYEVKFLYGNVFIGQKVMTCRNLDSLEWE